MKEINTEASLSQVFIEVESWHSKKTTRGEKTSSYLVNFVIF